MTDDKTPSVDDRVKALERVNDILGQSLVKLGFVENMEQWKSLSLEQKERYAHEAYPSDVLRLEDELQGARISSKEIEDSGNFCVFRGHLTDEQIRQDSQNMDRLVDELILAEKHEATLTVEQRVEVLRARAQEYEDRQPAHSSGWHNNGGNDQDGGMEQ